MKFYRINNFYLNKNEKSYFDSSLIVVYKDDVYNLGEIEFEDLYLLAKENSSKYGLNKNDLEKINKKIITIVETKSGAKIRS